MGIMVKALAISLCSGNSTFAPSGWFMHAWSHISAMQTCLLRYIRVWMLATCNAKAQTYRLKCMK